MKKMLRSVTALLLAVILTVGAAVPASAASLTDPTVFYNGYTKEIEFRNAIPFGDNTQPDLFVNMKNMMPGDSVTQKISIGARNMGLDGARIWLRAENPNADYTKLMETYGHWVTFRVLNGEEEITGNLADGVELGTFYFNQTTTVTVELDIDIEAGNELQALVAEIDWVFTAEVIPTVIPDPGVDDGDVPWLTDDHINYIIGYPDNTVRPQGSITRAEVATIFYRLLKDEVREDWFSTTTIYPDVNAGDWFYVAVCTLTNGGILEGYPDGTFQPNDPISRAELATILSRFDMKYQEIVPDHTFPDVKTHWAKDPVEFAATRGYVVGYPDGYFRPDRDITRAETVTMVNRCLRRAVDEIGLTEDYLTWPDNQKGSWYYYEIIEAANYHDYARSERPVENHSYTYENWTYLHELIDWAYVEREWILIYTGE